MSLPLVSEEILYFCQHCQSRTRLPFFTDDDRDKKRPFCCSGCMAVNRLLKLKNLSEYYQIKKKFLGNSSTPPVESKNLDYSHWQLSDFYQLYVRKIDSETIQLKVYLENIHCIACMWLLEKLPEIFKSIKHNELNFENSILTLTLEKNANLTEVARTLLSLGYTPHPLRLDESQHMLWEKEKKSQMRKMGVAFFSAGNIMLFAISIYAGADQLWAKSFSWISLFLALPVYFYSATPLYQSAWSALKQKKISVDFLATMAIFLSGIVSVKNTWQGNTLTYFDTTTTFIALILLTRFFLKYETHKIFIPIKNSLFGEKIKKWNGVTKKFELTLTQYLQKNEIIQIPAGQLSPVDGKIIAGESFFDESTMSGEVNPVRKKIGDPIWAGTHNQSGLVEAKVVETADDSLMGRQISKALEQSSENIFIGLGDKFAQSLALIILFLSVFLILYFSLHGQIKIGLERSLALFLVACPCGFAFAIPLLQLMAKKEMQKKGIYVFSENILEKLNKITKVYFDKTGTLTSGDLEVEKFLGKDNKKIVNLWWNLEKDSLHPLAMAIKKYLSANHHANLGQILLCEKKENLGKGISAWYEGKLVEIKAIEDSSYEENRFFLGLYVDHELVSSITLKETTRAGTWNVIKNLQKQGIKTGIISGDQSLSVKKLSENLGVDEYFANQRPQDKAQLLSNENNKYCLYVGDGLNDVSALKNAYLSFCLRGKLSAVASSFDGMLAKNNLLQITDLLRLAKKFKKIQKKILSISFIYNIVGIILVLLGLIPPLCAAFLMPLSTLGIFIATLFAKKEFLKPEMTSTTLSKGKFAWR